MAPKSKPKAAASSTVNDPTVGSKSSLPASPGLWLVSTPIGNARDITLRALDALSSADIIACEDTRVSRKLLSIHGIKGPHLLAYHDHNAKSAGPKLIDALKDGKNVALICDAGTPMINDPGFRLVHQVLAEGLDVTSLPGASAVLTGLQLSGLPTDRFFYLGFPPVKGKARQEFFQDVSTVAATLVFLESPKRLAKSLFDMKTVFGNRDAAVARELTKTFEEVRRDNLDSLAQYYEKAGPPKGEVTVIVAPTNPEAEIDWSDDTLLQALTSHLNGGSLKDAVDAVTAMTGLPRRRVYQLALTLVER